MNLKNMSFERFQFLQEELGTVEFITNVLRVLKLTPKQASKITGVQIQNFHKWLGGKHSIGFLSMHSLYYKLIKGI